MKIKEGASIAGLDIFMRPALIHADKLWRINGNELVITSGLDGTHSAGSYHYYGLALDFRTYYFDRSVRLGVRNKLALELGELYDVVLESRHMHVEPSRKWEDLR